MNTDWRAEIPSAIYPKLPRIFRKISGGKKQHISGLVDMKNYGTDLTSLDSSPLMMQMPSDENHTTRFIGTELSHSACFSSPMEGHRQNFLHELSSSPLRNSGFSTRDSIFMSPTPRIQNLHHPGSHALIREMNSEAKSDISHDTTGMNTDIYSAFSSRHDDKFRPFVDQDFAPKSSCPIELDCSWDF